MPMPCGVGPHILLFLSLYLGMKWAKEPAELPPGRTPTAVFFPNQTWPPGLLSPRPPGAGEQASWVAPGGTEAAQKVPASATGQYRSLMSLIPQEMARRHCNDFFPLLANTAIKTAVLNPPQPGHSWGRDGTLHPLLKHQRGHSAWYERSAHQRWSTREGENRREEKGRAEADLQGPPRQAGVTRTSYTPAGELRKEV